jgi:predicted TIM-barrel fold metal-dependent hydrolase
MVPKLIDCHLHLVYPDAAKAGWMANNPAIYGGKGFTWPDFDRLPGRQHIAASVFMEVDVDEGGHGAESEQIATLIADPLVPVIGQIAACRPEHDERFEAWIERGDELGVVGYRRILHVGVPDDLSQAESFRANVRKIGAAGKVFDICVFARQLPLAVELIDACPDTQFVLDHCGNPDVAAGETAQWRAGLRDIARRSNVVVKMSGILANCAPDRTGEAVVRPYIEEMISIFGPGRIVWGSDWPVVTTRSSLGEWVSMSRNILSALSSDEQLAIAQDNARRIYRLDWPTNPGGQA